MPPPIRVNFQVGGVASVDQALRSVEQATARVERISKRAYDDDVRAAKKASAEKEREFAKLGKWVEQQRMKDLRDANKLATDELKGEGTLERLSAASGEGHGGECRTTQARLR